MSAADEPQLKVIARAPFHVYYEGLAYSLSATNKVGNFDILPGHADFFSMLSPGKIIIETADDQIAFEAHNGMLTVKSDEVMLFVNM